MVRRLWKISPRPRRQTFEVYRERGFERAVPGLACLVLLWMKSKSKTDRVRNTVSQHCIDRRLGQAGSALLLAAVIISSDPTLIPVHSSTPCLPKTAIGLPLTNHRCPATDRPQVRPPLMQQSMSTRRCTLASSRATSAAVVGTAGDGGCCCLVRSKGKCAAAVSSL